MENTHDLKPKLEDAPAYPQEGHVLTDVEQRLDEANRIKPRVTIFDENGATEVVGRKIVSEEQIQTRLSTEGASFAEKNPEYSDIAKEIPSNMVFYPGTTLCIRTFKTPHIIKLIEAMEMEDLSMIVDVVSSVLEPSFSAYDLTPEDFFYCLYWLKINSFKKHPYEVKFVCTNPEHHEKVLRKQLASDTLRNVVVLKQMGQLTINKITEDSLAKSSEILARIKAEYEVDVFAMRMKDYVELQGYLKRSAALALKIEELSGTDAFDSAELDALKLKKRELDSMYAMKDYAPYICLANPKATIADKLNYLNDLDVGPDFLGDLDEFIKSLSHGVKETAVCHCQECKAEVEIDVSIEALHFFPEIIRRRFVNAAV